MNYAKQASYYYYMKDLQHVSMIHLLSETGVEVSSPILCNGSKGQIPDKQESGANNGKERIMCPVCRTIVVRRVYRRHYETMHCVQAPVTCQFCFKVKCV